ncbi:glycoside hydrolase family 30 beta sandwich domain-containing protein [Sphingobacterium sp.]|uniref:glycoside hydrolase family 30 beta sandwich domain-containing protein n=1 Tax=Sphingobacterium sp. TaxID=341027 RepID=UPI0031DFFD06
MTEASEAGITGGGGTDGSMKTSMKLAVSLHKFMTTINANAYVWWLGMAYQKNTEALIWHLPESGSLTFPKLYDVMGLYSRFIRKDYQRIGITVTNDFGLLTSAYRDPQTSKFVLVVTNPTGKEIPLKINLSGFMSGDLSNYQTTDNTIQHWGLAGKIAADKNGVFNVKIPAMSVSTLEGKKCR